MNYDKTNIIKKLKKAIDARSLLGILLLFFLLTSSTCMSSKDDRNQVSSPSTSSPSSSTPPVQHVTEKNNFLSYIGGWGPCGYNCLLNQIIETATTGSNPKKKTLKKSGIVTYVIPSKVDGKDYFTNLLGEDIVGNKSGRSFFSRNKNTAKFQLSTGVSGKMRELAAKLLQEYTKCKIHPRFFVVAKFMEFSEAVRKSINEKTNDAEVIADIEKAFEYFTSEIKKVSKAEGGKGIRIIIPGGKDAENGGLLFEEAVDQNKPDKTLCLNDGASSYVSNFTKEIEAKIRTFREELSK